MTRFLPLALILATAVAAAPEKLPERPARAFLLTDAPVVAPGDTVRVGVLIKAIPGWHVYWKNPGDAGVGTRVLWDLPEGWSAGPMRWPVPERLVEPGDVTVFAYEEGVLLFRELTVPATARPGDRVGITADADWLVCKTACVPGAAKLTGQVVVGRERQGAGALLFDRWQARLPASAPAAAALADVSGVLAVRLPLEDPGHIPDVFPDPGSPEAELLLEGGEVDGDELVVYVRFRYGTLPEAAAPGAEGPALVLAHHGEGGAVRGRRVPLVAVP